MIHRFDCELRVLVEPLGDGLFRCCMVELDLAVSGTCAVSMLRLLRDSAASWIEQGKAVWRMGDDAPPVLLEQFRHAEQAEQHADAFNELYNGPWARVLHVSAEWPVLA